MQVGDLVIYKKEYRIWKGDQLGVGVIIDRQALGLRMLIEWNNGQQNWRHINVLEALCK